MLLITSAVVLLGLLLVPYEADALPDGAVGYKLYHYEGTEWVRYIKSQGDTLPPGGADPGTNLWKYKYCAENVGYADGIYQFLIFFNSDNKDTAQYVSETAPSNWTPRYFAPIAPDANWKVRFRADGPAYYIAQGDTLGGFEVEFTWTDPTRLPADQNYDLGSPGGSEPGNTHELPSDITPVETTTWGRLKSLFVR